jgi:acetyltransferase
VTTRNLERLLAPRSVALIGASVRPGRAGTVVWENLQAGGFAGELWPVNPKYDTVGGVPCYAAVASLPAAPDLAVLCTPPKTIPGLVAKLAERGTRAVTVISSLVRAGRDDGAALAAKMLEAARPHTLRVLGPGCAGLLVPGIGLNASVACGKALPGRLAFVSQSDALVSAVLDWAGSRDIGFSHFVALGDAADVDLGDLIDYLGADPQTGAILVCTESVASPRKFMSAARAAARNKPVVIVKAGRAGQGPRAAATHTGAILGSDAVYDAAIRRAGMLRVHTTEDLFAAVSLLANARPLAGDGLAVVTNGGGPGVMAMDELGVAGLPAVELAADTVRTLDRVLPRAWSGANPVDIGGDADAARYAAASKAVLSDPGSGTLLVIHVPSAAVPSLDVAQALLPEVTATPRNVLAAFMGGDSVAPARECLEQAGVPCYETPEQAVRAFAQLVQYRRNQELLMEVPALLRDEGAGAAALAGTVVRAALAAGRTSLSEPEAKAVLRAYGIPVVETRVALDAAQAAAAAAEIGFPVAVKVLSQQLVHKSDAGGVVLDLEDADAVLAACQAIARRVAVLAPQARIDGFTVQAMARRPDAHELIVGAALDPVFGPVVLFGQGGIAVEALDDRAVALPPLNQVLARDLVSRARVARLLQGYRGRPAADHDAIHRALIAVGQMLAEVPEIVELDINPLLADRQGVLALDARIVIAAGDGGGVGRFAILPYPQHLVQSVPWRGGGELVVRPIRPEDAPAHLEFFAALDPADVRARVMGAVRALRPGDLARLTQIDYDREMALIATRRRPDGRWETLGVARSHADPDRSGAEFAVIVRSDMKGAGLGGILMLKLISHCRAHGIGELRGETFADNAKMLKMARALGFALTPDPAEGVVRLSLRLGG